DLADQKKNNTLDRVRYQTVYAEPSGSVAAPTAGLHFSDDLLRRLEDHNCQIEPVTLHVGAGTFLPVKTLNINEHVMHSERFMVPSTTLAAIRKAKDSSRPIVVVGTTALRALEGLDLQAKELETTREAIGDLWHRTQIFIKQTTRSDIFTPWACDGLMTNFHQPESTLFMLISSLVGFDAAKSIYASAIAEKYRFFSYGDSSLLWLPDKK
ncbi:MAG: S-adenosylmethionine:tRNA ribosyltransferase-isomerase, partial [Proteobacteria bacterium]|nr:S-adenosylmethionine:tRNA ribosyltransferase-isomerase [Pseudomonadota bacterium]